MTIHRLFADDFSEARNKINDILTAIMADEPTQHTQTDKLISKILPSGNVYSRKSSNGITFKINLAGIKKEYINLSYDKNDVILDVRIRSTDGTKDEFIFMKEFTVPDDYDMDSITTTYEDGLLVITINKRIDKRRTKIDIK